MKAQPTETLTRTSAAAPGASLGILLALSMSHLLNDAIQAVIPAIYPLIKDSFELSFSQIGFITLAFQMTGSVFQPLVGMYTDRVPRPYSLAVGMGITLTGLVLLAFAGAYSAVLAAAALIGLGSAIFHPESSRMARLASGGRHGFAQSLFQVGGNAGSAVGPLLAAWIIVPRGQRYLLAFSVLALCGIGILTRVGDWYSRLLQARRGKGHVVAHKTRLSAGRLSLSICVLLALMFSKFFYLASISSYYTFYLIQKFGVSVQQSQYGLFLFLAAVALGTLGGGILGDRFGRKAVIWLSILGMAPFALALPHASLAWTAVLSVIIGFLMASAFPAILVYATELLPGRVGLISGLFFGLAFGLGGIGSAVLGQLADATSIPFVMSVCAFLPLLGLLTAFLPDLPQGT